MSVETKSLNQRIAELLGFKVLRFAEKQGVREETVYCLYDARGSEWDCAKNETDAWRLTPDYEHSIDETWWCFPEDARMESHYLEDGRYVQWVYVGQGKAYHGIGTSRAEASANALLEYIKVKTP